MTAVGDIIRKLDARVERVERERDEAQNQYKMAVNRINMVLEDGRRYEHERDEWKTQAEQWAKESGENMAKVDAAIESVKALVAEMGATSDATLLGWSARLEACMEEKADPYEDQRRDFEDDAMSDLLK